jgi:hypothetical protein
VVVSRFGNPARRGLQFVYNFRILPWQFPCAILVFLFCARPGPALSLAMFTTPRRAGQAKFVETAATPEDCCRRADDDSLTMQAPAWCDVAVAAIAVGDCWPLFATAASSGAHCGSVLVEIALVERIGRVKRAEVRASLLRKRS